MNQRTWLIILAIIIVLLGGGAAVLAIRELGKSEAARRLTLIPAARAALDDLIEDLAKLGVQVFVGSTRRTPTEQSVAVSSGASSTQQSWHLLDRAVDLYPIDPETGQPDLNGKRTELFRIMHERAELHGWRGIAFNADGTKRYLNTSKGRVWDGGHLEFPEGLTWAQAEAVKRSGLA
jgi:hypothetical protein